MKKILFVMLSLLMATSISYGEENRIYEKLSYSVNKVVEERETEELNKRLNTTGNSKVDIELNKLPNKVKELLVKNNVKIYLEEGMIENLEAYGMYDYETNIIKLDPRSIDVACVHECMHAIDDYNEGEVLLKDDFISSWENDEVWLKEENNRIYDFEYFAECGMMYWNGDLPADTLIYKVLDEYFSQYK